MLAEIVITDGDESSLLLRVQQYPWDVDVFPITGVTSMCSLPVFVGLDYHDASVRVCVLDTDGRELANADRCNDWKAIAEFADRFGRPVRAAIESCCGAADLAEELVSCAGRWIWLTPATCSA